MSRDRHSVCGVELPVCGCFGGLRMYVVFVQNLYFVQEHDENNNNNYLRGWYRRPPPTACTLSIPPRAI